jgi:formylglycine-generating enzyme
VARSAGPWGPSPFMNWPRSIAPPHLFAAISLVACHGGRVTDDAAQPAWLKPSNTQCPQNCGGDAASDCCASGDVPGGTFLRDYDTGSDGEFSDMSYPATLSPFALDKYEVTVGRFRQFVDLGGGLAMNAPPVEAGAHSNIEGSGWNASWIGGLAPDIESQTQNLTCYPTSTTWTATPGPNENLPINCVNWYEAFAFCAWDGGVLPTTAQWNFAASGGDEQRVYPWSVPPDSMAISCADASYYDSSKDCDSVSVVGSRPAGDSKWGQSDMGGNVAEWCFDVDAVLTTTTSVTALYVEPCVDCARLAPDPQDPNNDSRVARGGAFDGGAMYERISSSLYDAAEPSEHLFEVGFRCARQPL